MHVSVTLRLGRLRAEVNATAVVQRPRGHRSGLWVVLIGITGKVLGG
jgi:hypothetical protein